MDHRKKEALSKVFDPYWLSVSLKESASSDPEYHCFLLELANALLMQGEISALRKSHVTWLDHSLYFLDHDPYLPILPKDSEILKEAKTKVLDFFMMFVVEHELVLVYYDEQRQFSDSIVDPRFIFEVGARYDTAYLYEPDIELKVESDRIRYISEYALCLESLKPRPPFLFIALNSGGVNLNIPYTPQRRRSL